MIAFARDFDFPDDAITQTFAFLARRGAGKSYGAMKLAEGMLAARAQAIALDPVGVWWSLRLGADGKRAGFDIPVFGGLHGDFPLEPGAGAFMADLLVERGISAVLDVSMFRKADRKRFATEFAEQLFHLKKKHRSPLHLFIEEAQVFVPQRVMGDEARMLGAFEDIIKLGRNFGIGATLISQRPQAVNKDALNQTEALVVLQTNGAQERKALHEWIVEHGVSSKELVDDLPGLPIGTAYVWSPSWLRKLEKVKIGKRTTYDASATPVAGVAVVETRPLKSSEAEQIKAAMVATIERAKAEDPKALRARIATLERELQQKPTAAVGAVAAPKRIDVPVIDKMLASNLEQHFAETKTAMQAAAAAIKALENDNERCEKLYGRVLKAVEKHGIALDQPAQGAAEDSRQARPRNMVSPGVARTASVGGDTPALPRSRSSSSSSEVGDFKFRDGARRMLQACATFMDRGLTKSQLIVLSRVKAGGTFSTYLGELKRASFVEERQKRFFATDVGVTYLGNDVPAPPRSADDIVSFWRSRFRDGAVRMLDAIVDAYPGAIGRSELAERAAVAKGGTFSTYLGELKRAELIDEREDGLYASALELVRR